MDALVRATVIHALVDDPGVLPNNLRFVRLPPREQEYDTVVSHQDQAKNKLHELA